MLENYFKTALRSLLKQKSYTIINIIGLSTGLAAAIFIFLFVLHEKSYDKFHKKGERIYRMLLNGKLGEMELGPSAYTPNPMAFTMLEEFPEIEQATRIRTVGERMVKYGKSSFIESGFLYVDSTFFDVFTFPLLQGDPKTALKAPKSLVLTTEMATKYFKNENPLGKTLKINSDTTIYTITGVVNSPPENSSIQFDFLASISTFESSRDNTWVSNNVGTFIVIGDKSHAPQLIKKFPELVNKYVGPQIKQFLHVTMDEFYNAGNKYEYLMQPFLGIHLDNSVSHDLRASNDIRYLYIFSFIAVFILIIASINFMNLATAKSATRAKEVGVRKVVGSHRKQLIFQFITESVILCLISMIIALALVQIFLPYFNSITGLEIDMSNFQKWYFPIVMLLIALVVGILAGSYPAFFLSAFVPAKVLKGDLKSGTKNGRLRGALVIFQFAISVIILIGTFIIYNQINHLINKDLGFNKEQLLVINRAYSLNGKMKSFKDEILKKPEITKATYSSAYPGRFNSNNGFQMEGETRDKTYLLWVVHTDEDFADTYQFKIKEGRFYEDERASDSIAVLINEKSLSQFGISEPLTKRFIRPSDDGTTFYLNTIGIVKDFHFQSLREEIRPTMFLKGQDDNFLFLTLKIRPENMTKTIKSVENMWREFTNNQPFEYNFVDERFARLYSEERRTAKLSAIFSGLAIIIACLGLFGLVSFIAQQRTKEIGIRKTLGASVPQIITLLSKEIVSLIVIASAIGWGVSYWLMRKWLENYAYHIEQNILIYLSASLILFIIAMLTISFQALKVATTNPAEALQYE